MLSPLATPAARQAHAERELALAAIVCRYRVELERKEHARDLARRDLSWCRIDVQEVH